MNRIFVNGKEIVCNGKSVSVINGTVIVDGKVIDGNENNNNVEVVINGDVESVNCDGIVRIQGNARSVKCGGSCSVGGTVSGDVQTGGSVHCGNIGGSVFAGGSIYRS